MPANSLKQKGISLYYQIETYIRGKIESGEWSLGSKVPTEAELSEYFNVSRTTIRQAVNGMVEAGLLVRRQGSGTYVAQSPYARNRLSAQPSDAVCKYIYMPALRDDMEHSYKNLLMTNISHILMLCQQKIIAREDGQRLLEFILPLLDKHPKTIGSNPLNEDYLLNFEQFLISSLGMELGGKIHIAQSRNDMTPTVVRMSIRDSFLIICDRLLALMRRLLHIAEENHGRIITGYTHCQPAQPITLEHYFLAVAEALERDFSRLLHAYKSLNLSPLGACALAGTSYLIDREYTAKLLGFDGIVQNTLDAVAARDYLLELSADFATLGSTLARFAQDLYLWSTSEFGYVTFSDADSCCSSTMPQKKNPLSIEHIKSKSAHLASAYFDILMCLKGTVYSHSRDLFECMPPFWASTEQMTGILELFLDTLQDIQFHYDRMELLAETNDSALTDLADCLVRKEDISFRQAHTIVTAAVKERGEGLSGSITLEQLNRIMMQTIGRETCLTDAELASLLSARNSIERKLSEGSPSRSSCRKLLLSLRSSVDQDDDALNQLTNSLNLAERLCRNQIDALLSRD